MQEREADTIGAAILILFVTGYDPQRALGLFDKLAQLEARADGPALDPHDTAAARKRAVAGVIADLRQRAATRGPERR